MHAGAAAARALAEHARACARALAREAPQARARAAAAAAACARGLADARGCAPLPAPPASALPLAGTRWSVHARAFAASAAAAAPGGVAAEEDPWAIHYAAAARARAGEDVLLLGMGVPDTPTSHAVRAAAAAALDAPGGEGYAPAMGDERLRAAVVASMGADAASTSVCVTPGAQTALYMALRVAVARAGGSAPLVMTPAPAYTTYEHTIAMAGGEMARVETDEDAGFALHVSDLTAGLDAARAAGRAVAAVLLTNPHNPTGNVLSREELLAVGALCEAAGAMLIVDEVYAPLVFGASGRDGGGFAPVASVPELARHAFAVGSLSKAGLRPGWRVGWLAAPVGAEAEVEALSKAVLFGASPATQAAALTAMPLVAPGNAESRRYAARARALAEALADAEAAYDLGEGSDNAGLVHLHAPRGGLFAMVRVRACGAASGAEFASRLLEDHGVSVLPGGAFGAPDWVRVGLLADEAGMARAGAAIAATAKSFACEGVAARRSSAERDESNARAQGRAGEAMAQEPARGAVVVGGAAHAAWAREMHAHLQRQLPRAQIALWTEDQQGETSMHGTCVRGSAVMPRSIEWSRAALAVPFLTHVPTLVSIRMRTSKGALDAVRGAQAVFAWDPPRGLWDTPEVAQASQLALVQALGVGVDCLARGGAPPPRATIARVVDERAGARYARYVLAAALAHCAGMGPDARRGKRAATMDPADCAVGVMGSGAFGTAAAGALADAGFDVAVWSRKTAPRCAADVEVMLGPRRMGAFLARTRVLVLALPAVPATIDLVAEPELRALQAGGCVINVGRGEGAHARAECARVRMSCALGYSVCLRAGERARARVVPMLMCCPLLTCSIHLERTIESALHRRPSCRAQLRPPVVSNARCHIS